MPITIQTAALPGGVRLPYAEHGSADGVPVVLLHGITDSWRSFEPVLPHLPASVHAYSLTLRGHADTEGATSFRLEDMVRDVADFLDAVGLPSAVVCGHSMGSIVATRFAIDHPDRTDGLVVMGGATSFARLGLDEMTAELAGMTDPVDLDYLRGFQESTLARPAAPGWVDVAVSESAKVGAATFRDAWHGVVLQDFAADLHRIAAPTLLVWGELDAFSPRSEQDALATAIGGARLVVHEGAGHAFHWEDPARFAGELTAFAGDVAAGIAGLHVEPPAGDGELLVLVHGSWTDHTTWAAVAGPLAERFRVVRYDRRGHSRSPYAGPVPRRRDEDDLIALVERLGEPAHLVGTSYGACISLAVAGRRPDLVRSVVAHEPPLLGLRPDPQVGAQLQGVWEQLASGDVEGGTRRFFDEVALGPGAWDALPDALCRAATGNAQTFLDLREDPRWRELDVEAVARFAGPITVTLGDAAPAWLPRTARAVAEAIGRPARLIPGAGHAPQLTHPEAFVAVVADATAATRQAA